MLVIKRVYQEVSSMNNHLHYKHYESRNTMNLGVV